MPISEKDVSEARQAWGEALIEISKIFEADGIKKAHSLASKLLDDLYGFELGSVLFKPTLSGGKKTFRNDKEGTLDKKFASLVNKKTCLEIAKKFPKFTSLAIFADKSSNSNISLFIS